jgi:hypothetical protein
MAFRYFPGKTEAWLLAELETAMTDQSAGRTVVSASSGDVSFSHMTHLDIDERMRRIKHDLVAIDPTTYPPEDYLQPSRTQVNFS